MTKKQLFLCVLGTFLILGFALNQAGATTPSAEQKVDPEILILVPGMASSCQNDFVIENIDDENAELKVVLGNETFLEDRIEGKEAKAYGLRRSLTEAKMKGQPIEMNDIATIFNEGDRSRIRLFCVE